MKSLTAPWKTCPFLLFPRPFAFLFSLSAVWPESPLGAPRENHLWGHCQAVRAVLNLGHTVGHAVEAQAGFERLTHGEAVGLGLVAALRIGQKLGHTPAELADRTRKLLGTLQLMTAIEDEPLAAAAELIGHDKKRAGSKVNFVFARGMGDVITIPLDLAELRELTRGLTTV